ncbi:MAG: hypothetical protein EOO56_14900 [Hymenobacter sp.]|nr:MAG: hypothetical protein EOO56_14900 [Hymenobacter sp.]
MPTRLLFFSISVLAGLCISCEQNARRQEVFEAQEITAIDSLATSAQVRQFVRKWGSNCYRFIVTDSLYQDCVDRQTCLTPDNRRSWVKADFDNDGSTDLLVTGRDSEHFVRDRSIICFLNKRQQSPRIIWLAEDGDDCPVAQVGYLRNKAIIRYAHVSLSKLRGAQTTSSRQSVCRIDTLVFKEPGFIEYSRAPKDYQIQRVAFSTEACYGSCPIFELHVARNGAATYRAEEYNERKGTFTATVDAQAIKELWDLLNYLNFPQLEEKYAVRATDHPTCTLTITYADGKVKTIEDYGEQGTFGLQRAYELLFALRNSQAWK